MADFLTKSQRSALMASIKGKANKGTELRLAELFREHGIKGWRRHYPIPGKPDFVFTKAKLAIFVDGCFWHGCPWHYRPPTSNVAFWQQKIESNRSRDKKTTARIRQKGWTVIRIWEHSFHQPERILARIQKALAWIPTGQNRPNNMGLFLPINPRFHGLALTILQYC